MANPQKEDGHVRIANEIIEALCRIRIPGECRQILDFIIRKTWGFGKKEDRISLSQFHLGTGISKRNVRRAIGKLLLMNLAVKKDLPPIPIYRFNKDFDSWKPMSKKTPGSKMTSRGVEDDLGRGVKEEHHNKQDTITTITTTTEEDVLKKEFTKWLGTFEKIQNPKAYTETLFKKYPAIVLKRAIKNTNCTSPAKLSSLIEHYQKESLKKSS
jgi:phage replication O-like protein O